MYADFPLEYENTNLQVHVNIKEIKESNFAHRKISYNIEIIKGNKTKILNSEIYNTCNKVAAIGYVKSPYENKIAVIVIYSRYVFEDSEMFISLYGCSLDTGFD